MLHRMCLKRSVMTCPRITSHQPWEGLFEESLPVMIQSPDLLSAAYIALSLSYILTANTTSPVYSENLLEMFCFHQ